MNRKIGVILLALVAVMCLSLGACKLEPGSGLTKDETLQNYLFEYEDQVVKEDFILPTRIGDYRATWTSDSKNVVLEKRKETKDYLAKVTIPENDETVTLTADLRGAKKSYTIRLQAITTQDIMDAFNFAYNRGAVDADFELPSETTYKGKTATISWAVEDEKSQGYISVVDGVCKVIPSSLNPEVRINATFTYKGVSKTTYYRFTVTEKMEHLQEVDYWYSNTGVSITMKGYVVEIGVVWSSTYNNVSLYIVDENMDAGYYLYRIGCDAANAANLRPGVYVEATGTTNTVYNGLYETNAGGTLKVDPSKTIDLATTVYAIDRDFLAAAPAANYNQSRMVSLTGWKVVSKAEAAPDEGKTATLFTLQKDKVKVSVAVSKYMEGAYLTKKADATWSALVAKYNEVKVGDIVSVKGILGNYKGAQIIPLSADDIVIGGEESAYAESAKVKAAMAEVNAKFDDLPKLITKNETVELPATSGDVQIEYKLLGIRSAFAISEGKLLVIPGAAEKATVQVKYTCGGYSAYNFRVMQAENLDDQGKADWEIENLDVLTAVTVAGEYDLPATSFFDNAKIVWTTEAKYATIKGTKLTVDLPLVAERMKLTATVTVGEKTATRDYYVSVSAMNTSIPTFLETNEAGEYKMGLFQGNLGKYLYLTGKLSSTEFLETTTEYEKAAKVTVTATAEGFTYQIGGKYLEPYKNGAGSYRAHLTDASTGSWVYDETNKVYTFTVDGDKYFLNAYNNFETAGVSKISYISGAFLAKFVKEVKTATAQDLVDQIVAGLTTTVTENFALDFKATWEVVSGTGIEIEGLTAKVTRTEAAQTVVLKATLAYGEATASKEVEITVAAIPPQNPAPVEGTYAYGLYQKTLGKTLYAKAEIANQRYLATTENPIEAAEFTLVKATDAEGYRILVDGKYVEVGNNDNTKLSVLLKDTATGVWTWNEEAGVMTFAFNGKVYYLGTYNNFNTISASETSYITGTNVGNIGVTQFVCTFQRPVPLEGEYNYKLYQVKNAKTLYAKAEISGRYLATTENVAEAAKIVLAKSGEGYTLKMGDKYLEAGYNSSNKSCVLLNDTATGVWKWNDEAGVMTWTTSDNKVWYLGTYSTFSTLSISETYRITGENAAQLGTSQFVCKFVAVSDTPVHTHAWGEGVETLAATCTTTGVKTFTCECGETKTEPLPALGHVDANNDGVCDRCNEAMPVVPTPEYETKTLAEFVALTDDDTKFYKIEGVVVKVENATYGNLYITDGTTTLLVYGLCAAKMEYTNGKFVNAKDFNTLGVEVGTHIVIVSAKTTFGTTIEAVGSGLLEKSNATDKEMIYVAKYNVKIADSVSANFELPTYEGVNIAWSSDNAAIAISGTTATVTQSATEQTVTLTAVYTCNTATETVTYEVKVAAKIEGVQTITFDFVNTVKDWTEWDNSYKARSITSKGVTIDFTTANKQNSGAAIDDCPVVRAKKSTEHVTVDMGNTSITSVTFNIKWWKDTEKLDSITVEYAKEVDGVETWVKCGTGTLTANSEVTGTGFTATKVRLVLVKTANSNGRIGLTSIAVTTAA